jgi:hypothetical protein
MQDSTARPIGLVGNVFIILDILLMVFSALAAAVLFIGIALLSMIGAGVSWRAEPLLGLLVTPPFLVLELTAIGTPVAALAQVQGWRARWFLQAISLGPLALALLWLVIERGKGHG